MWLFPSLSNGQEIEGPFPSLNGIRFGSSLYRRLKLENPNLAEKVMQSKNIVSVFSAVKSSSDLPAEFKQMIWKIIHHSYSGEISNNDVSGVHFYRDEISKNVRVVSEGQVDANGVWEASVEIYNKSTKKWISKSKTSTMFPKAWSLDRVVAECYSAYQGRVRVAGKTSQFEGLSNSGVKIIFVFNSNNRLASVYPIIFEV